MDKMKILILFTKYKGGVGSVVKNIQKELEKKGHKVDAISRDDDLKMSFWKSLPKLRKLVKKRAEKYDIIYTQDWSIAFPLLYPFEIAREKHFCCFHGIQPGKARILQRKVGEKLGNKLIVVGDGLKKMFPKARLNYNGVDIKKFKPKKVKKIKNSVGFVNWQTSDYNFKKIKRAVEKTGKRFVIAEDIPLEKMPDFYSKLDIFISLPPFCTGFNMSWIEAMACGVKKIIGNNAGIGNKLPIEKIEAYKGNISESLTKVKGRDYRKWVEKSNFTLDKYVENLLKIWKK